LEDVYCATSPTLEFVPDENGVPVYIGVGCCDDAGVCHRYDGANNNAGCFAGTYDIAANVLPRPKTWDQAVELCHNEGKELCAAPLSMGVCLGKGCNYNQLYQWSTTECEPDDANYREGCETPTAMPTTWWDNKKKRKDDSTLLIIIVVCSVAGCCCLLAISTATVTGAFGSCLCFAKPKKTRVAEPSAASAPPMAHATKELFPAEEAVVVSVPVEAEEPPPPPTKGWFFRAEPEIEPEAEEPPPPPAKSWWFGRAEPEPEEAERPPPLSPFSTLRAQREQELAFEPEA